jgi:hypothetical protein
VKFCYGDDSSAFGRTARVSIVRLNLKEAVGKITAEESEPQQEGRWCQERKALKMNNTLHNLYKYSRISLANKHSMVQIPTQTWYNLTIVEICAERILYCLVV